MQADPLGYVDGPNLYLTTLANPVSLLDPDGLNARLQARAAEVANYMDLHNRLIHDLANSGVHADYLRQQMEESMRRLEATLSVAELVSMMQGNSDRDLKCVRPMPRVRPGPPLRPGSIPSKWERWLDNYRLWQVSVPGGFLEVFGVDPYEFYGFQNYRGWSDSYLLEVRRDRAEKFGFYTMVIGGIRSVGTPTVAPVKGIPQKATDTLTHVRKTGQAPQGYTGGRVFQNREGKLPQGGKYREYDVDPTPRKGQSRNAERIVVDETSGKAWYTDNHYSTFQEVK